MRDDRPFAGPAPPAAVYYASSDRRGEHPQKHLPAFAGKLTDHDSLSGETVRRRLADNDFNPSWVGQNP
ncbi:hypothetical protein IVA94_37205 [Bradyrhizobium sp. 156]|uniref:hypothetical protein n=1 Tax=Bradyrhizobium sp. 156 TaxID=2782630 RepID=UPI001FFA37F6|nr:hypothetical protein [Bradyrhizobium sp. 156]MCK1326404.1 hypothetical protein [Bradyrhizobium sp. 156]